MTVLSVIQAFCQRTGLPSPVSVLGSSDPQVIQVRAILEEEGTDLSRRGSWQVLTQEATHTTLALEDQGAISTIASNGFDRIKNETIWDRTDRMPVLGPESSSDWQAMQAFTVTGPRYRYRIRGGKLLVNPVPAAGNTWAFEYMSKNWILGADGTSYRQYFTLDTDTILLPEDLILLGLRWRWKKEKGFDYAEDFRSYEQQVTTLLGSDGGKQRLTMDGTPWTTKPGIWVSPGSWAI